MRGDHRQNPASNSDTVNPNSGLQIVIVSERNLNMHNKIYDGMTEFRATEHNLEWNKI